MRPAPTQPEVQDEQERLPPPRLNEDLDISFSDDDEVHVQVQDLETNKNGESKDPEEQNDRASEDKVSDKNLFEICCSDLGITKQGLEMMTEGQLGDLKMLFKKSDFSATARLSLAPLIVVPVQNATGSK